MRLRVKIIPLKLEHSSVILNPEDAAELGIIVGDRLKVVWKRRYCVADVQVATGIIEKGEIGVCTTVGPCEVEIPEGVEVEVYTIAKPNSVEYIRKKMNGEKLTKDEIYSIVRDISTNMLNEVELSAFVMANYLVGMDMGEIENLTRAMADTGETLSFERGTIVDTHSVSGVPGNKISLVIVPLIAATGLIIPKISSKAMAYASGTADTMEVFANVNLSVEEIREIAERVGGAIAWSGNTYITPADNRISRVEHPLSIDPKPHLLSSVIAKKGAAGIQYLAIDIPVESPRLPTHEVGRELASDFTELGRRMGLNVACILTYGGQPIGRAVGPALEAREALSALIDLKLSPKTLVEKSVGVAGVLLEMTGKAINGAQYAREILESGKALEKFKEIIEAQGGNPDIKPEDIPVGEITHTISSQTEGSVSRILNDRIIKIARAAGAPKDEGAGIVLHKKMGKYVKVGEPLFTIYAEKDWKLDRAIEAATREPPFVVSGIILERFPVTKYI